MDHDSTAIPRMPGVTEFLAIGNMGVELLASITEKGVIKD